MVHYTTIENALDQKIKKNQRWIDAATDVYTDDDFIVNIDAFQKQQMWTDLHTEIKSIMDSYGVLMYDITLANICNAYNDDDYDEPILNIVVIVSWVDISGLHVYPITIQSK